METSEVRIELDNTKKSNNIDKAKINVVNNDIKISKDNDKSSEKENKKKGEIK